MPIPARVLDTTVERLGDPRDPEAARKEGIALHALLQHLSRIDAGGSRRRGGEGAARCCCRMRRERTRELGAKALHRSSRSPISPSCSDPHSRAEVPFLAHGTRNGAPVTIAGRIDRLVVEPGRVLIVDFKSDARVPADESGVPPAYLTQMGLYALVAGQLFPDHDVEAAILWTTLETFMNLSSNRLSEAVASFTIG